MIEPTAASGFPLGARPRHAPAARQEVGRDHPAAGRRAGTGARGTRRRRERSAGSAGETAALPVLPRGRVEVDQRPALRAMDRPCGRRLGHAVRGGGAAERGVVGDATHAGGAGQGCRGDGGACTFLRLRKRFVCCGSSPALFFVGGCRVFPLRVVPFIFVVPVLKKFGFSPISLF